MPHPTSRLCCGPSFLLPSPRRRLLRALRVPWLCDAFPLSRLSPTAQNSRCNVPSKSRAHRCCPFLAFAHHAFLGSVTRFRCPAFSQVPRTRATEPPTVLALATHHLHACDMLLMRTHPWIASLVAAHHAFIHTSSHSSRIHGLHCSRHPHDPSVIAAVPPQSLTSATAFRCPPKSPSTQLSIPVSSVYRIVCRLFMNSVFPFSMCRWTLAVPRYRAVM
ncbi:hypothetical protein BDZ89DRAFT_1087055, partial [Hymenopellis radicata]